MAATLGCTCCDVTTGGVAELTASDATSVGASAYDALNPKGRRKAPPATTQHEDRHLGQESRRQLIGGCRDLYRNYSLIAWMVRQHLNYVCEHRFQARTGDGGLDDELEPMMAEEFAAERLDECEILDVMDYARCAESHAVVDGDFGTLFVDHDGGRLQGIEPDRIRNPNDMTAPGILATSPRELWFNGVRTTQAGRPIEYAIHRRVQGWTWFEFERRVPAAHFHLHAYRMRHDQARGISPLASAYNQARDAYEAEEMAMLRTKVASLFAMAIMRSGSQAAGDVSYETDDDGNPIRKSYEIDLGRGPIMLDLDPGDDAKFLDTSNPGASMQEFWSFVTRLVLKSLDVPYGLYDESAGNFFGNKTAWLGYDRSCETKRKRVRGLLNRVALFKLRQLVRSKRLTLPRGTVVSTRLFEWVKRGMPWWRPLEEVG